MLGHDTREVARAALVEGWDRERRQAPERSRVILASTREDVAALNGLARARLRAAGALGAEHQVGTERGQRAMAVGDRVMFLRNERGLGADEKGRGGVAVKNGTLGNVLDVEAGGERLTVRLDGAVSAAGQTGTGAVPEVTFHVRDYAHLDHGYAATVHKAQGITVDRAHVLASGYMDRHGAYTGLTRHRDGVALHYGRDEFADAAALARTLGRERAKDTSLDYGGGEDLARGYAVRRGLAPESSIVVRPAPERESPAAAEPAPTPARRGMFAGLKLGTGPAAGRMPQAPGAARLPGGPTRAEDALSQAVGRLAAGVQDAVRMREQDLPVLAHQHRALLDAQAAVEAARPGFCADLTAALRDGPGLLGLAVAGAAGRAALIGAAEAVQARRQEAARRAAEQERERQAALARRAELDPVRAQVLEGRMEAWWRTEKPGAAAWNRSWVPAAEVAAARAALSQQVEALPDAELRREAAEWARQAQQERAAEQERAALRPRPSGPSMGM